jgi:hypothetical protein
MHPLGVTCANRLAWWVGKHPGQLDILNGGYWLGWFDSFDFLSEKFFNFLCWSGYA